MYGQLGTHQYMHTSRGELSENQVSDRTIYMLAFLGGEFQYVADHAMNVKSALGWSSTFMKCGLAAFLLLLCKDSMLQQGGKAMCRKLVEEIGFNKSEYQKGLLKSIDEESQEWFWRCFCHWKETVSFSDEEQQKFMQWVEQLIAKRVDGIMEANRRNYYGECAGYIAVLGEVKESRGETGGKQRTMLEYKMQYPRRSAFHKELRAFGMKDKKK